MVSHNPSPAVRLFPSSFDPDDPSLTALARPNTLRWHTLSEWLTRVSARGVLSRLPLFWQTESIMHAACREARAFLYLNDASNMPVGLAAIEHANVDTIIATQDDAIEFSRFLASRGALVANWYIIHDATARFPSVNLSLATSIRHDIHLAPGISALAECLNHCGATPARFHLVDGFSAMNFGDRIALHSDDGDLDVKEGLAVPFRFTAEPQCTCGLPIIAAL